jgi:hypothetical protein
MKPIDRQRLKILAILLAVLAATLWVGQRIYDLPAAAADQNAPQGEAQSLDLDLEAVLSGARASGRVPPAQSDSSGAARRNPFEYGPQPAPERTAPAPAATAPTLPPPPVVPPPPPPPPPPIPFSYVGMSRIGGGQLQAWLFDDRQRFGVTEQEVLMGRYRINTITETFVEVEDLEFGRRQRLPLQEQ